MIKTVSALECVCSRCGHVWLAKNKNIVPKTCANQKCRSPYWNKEKIEKNIMNLEIGI